MSKDINEFYFKIGQIISFALDLENEIEKFISKYFVEPETLKTYFFEEIIVGKINFEEKIKIYQKICLKEKFNVEESKKIIKNIKYVQRIRNKIAHLEREINFDKEIYYKTKKSDNNENNILKLNEELIKKIIESKNTSIQGIRKQFYNIKINGTFEKRNKLRPHGEDWEIRYNELKKFVSINRRLPKITQKDKSEKKLALWCSQIRHKGKNKLLDEEKFNKLNKITNWYWDNQDMWEIQYNKLINFLKKHNKYPQAKEYKNPNKLNSDEETKLNK